MNKNDKDINDKDINDKDINDKDINDKDINDKDINDKDINDNIIFGHAATVNPFEEADQRELNNQIHLRYKKRNGKKVWTFIEGLDKETAKKLCKKWRTKWVFCVC